jgi:hypothetical protein
MTSSEKDIRRARRIRARRAKARHAAWQIIEQRVRDVAWLAPVVRALSP